MGKDKSYKKNAKRNTKDATNVEGVQKEEHMHHVDETCCFQTQSYPLKDAGLFGHIPLHSFDPIAKKPEISCLSILQSTDGKYEWLNNHVPNYDVLPNAEKYKALDIFGFKALKSVLDEVHLRWGLLPMTHTRPRFDDNLNYIDFDAPNTIGPCLKQQGLLYDDDISFGLQRLQGVNVGHIQLIDDKCVMCTTYGLPHENGSIVPCCCQLHNVNGVWIPASIDYGCGVVLKETANTWQWKYAKLVYQVSDFQDHELLQHLKSTHLVTEVIIMETMRLFRGQTQNVVYRLLVPHFQRTLAVNHEARNLLIPWIKSYLTNFTSNQVDQMLDVSSFDFQTLVFDIYLVKRGFRQGQKCFDAYYYGSDGLAMWNILLEFFLAVLQINTLDFHAISVWCTAIQEHIPSFPNIHNVEDLARVVTAIIFNASVLHSCLNDPQYYFQGFVPNMPATLRQPIQPSDRIDKQYYLDSLPDKEVMNLQRDLVSILSLNEPANSSFFTCLQEYRDVVPNDLFHRLEMQLSQLECVKRAIYPWMNPFKVTRSVIR